MAHTPQTPQTIVVYTDGACEKNGQEGAKAGIGVFFGPNDSRNVSRPLAGEVQTNQRAELAAFLDALTILLAEVIKSAPQKKAAGTAFAILSGKAQPTEFELNIYSDSTYCVKGWNEWLQGWVARKWKTSKKEPVSNQDLWKPVLLLKTEFSKLQHVHLDVKWVKGHADTYGNEEADKLAKAGVDPTRPAAIEKPNKTNKRVKQAIQVEVMVEEEVVCV
ncbi:ribonuclease H family protein [bacterium]|nr:ribonuclease H family protein [bacterium]